MKLVNLLEVVDEQKLKEAWMQKCIECIGFFSLMESRLYTSGDELNTPEEMQTNASFLLKVLATDTISAEIWKQLIRIFYPMDKRPIVIIKKPKCEMVGDIRDFYVKKQSEFGFMLKEGPVIRIEVCEI